MFFFQIDAEDGAVGIPLPVGPLDLGIDEDMPPPSQNTVAGQRYISQINSSASAMLARMFEGANMQNSTFNILVQNVLCKNLLFDFLTLPFVQVAP